MKKISFILATYKNVAYIDECLKSITEQEGLTEGNYEILLGIDNCRDTFFWFLNNKDKYKNLKCFWFVKKSKVSIIQNTLVDLSSGTHLIFFGTDDIMIPGAIRKILDLNKNYIRYYYYNFNQEGIEKTWLTTNYIDGSFFISKEIFQQAGGYIDWVCSSDSELIHRLNLHNINFDIIPEPLFYYRRHNKSLTEDLNTNHKSQLRIEYFKWIDFIKKSQPSAIPLKIKPVIGTYIELTKNISNLFIVLKFLKK